MFRLLVLLPLWLLVFPAQAQFNSFAPGVFSGRAALDAAAAGGGYTGPGDIFAFTGWWGIRAYSSATRGTKAINVCNVSDVACADMSTDATTGKLTVTTIGGSDCSIVVCTVKIIYDKVGTNDCSTGTIGSRPTLSVAGGPGGSFAALLFARASSQVLSCGALGASLTQPFTMSSVSERTGTTGSFNTILSVGSAEVLYNAGANSCGGYAGSVLVDSTHCADSAYHAGQVLFNTTGSVVIDGNTAVTGSIGSGGANSNPIIGNGTGGLMDGRFLEAGFANGDQSASFNSLNSNQHGANGYNF